MSIAKRQKDDEFLEQLVGKTIRGVVIKEREDSPPRSQVFLVFDDCHFEFYSPEGSILPTHGVWPTHEGGPPFKAVFDYMGDGATIVSLAGAEYPTEVKQGGRMGVVSIASVARSTNSTVDEPAPPVTESVTISTISAPPTKRKSKERTAVLVVLAVLAAALWIAYDHQTAHNSAITSGLHSLQKEITALEEAGFVSVEGGWAGMTPNSSEMIPRTNGVDIECFKEQLRCDEILAILNTERNFYYPQLTRFDVLEWSDDRIRAVTTTRAADLELSINLKSRIVERTVTETDARGADTGGHPLTYKWVLE